MPKVSFILPAFKRAYLHEAIASILGQTYTDFELVVVDDCSPEDLKSVVDEFHDARLTYHRNAENIGGKDLVAAWNHAMEYATGEWCVLASDDDVYLPQCLEELMKLQKKYPKCDLFHARNADINSEGKRTDVAFPRLEFESQIEMAYARSVLHLKQRAPDFMFRRTIWERNGKFVNFPLAWYSDEATWIKLAKNGCAHSREVLFCFRNSGINISSSHDMLVSQKILAGQMFIQWLSSIANEFQPQNEDDCFLLNELVPQASKEAEKLAVLLISEIKSFHLWWHCICNFSFSPTAKREIIYQRFPRIKALRRILPHWK